MQNRLVVAVSIGNLLGSNLAPSRAVLAVGTDAGTPRSPELQLQLRQTTGVRAWLYAKVHMGHWQGIIPRNCTRMLYSIVLYSGY